MAAKAVRLVFGGDVDALREMLEANPEIGCAQDESFNDSTPLHVAVGEGDEKCALLILEKCPRATEVSDVENRLPAHHVGTNTSPGLVNTLGHFNSLDNRQRTPLHYAAENMAVDAVEALLAAGADPSVECEEGKTPSMIAEGLPEDEDELPKANLLVLRSLRKRLGISEDSLTFDFEAVPDLDKHDFSASFGNESSLAPGKRVNLFFSCLDPEDEDDDDDDEVEERGLIEDVAIVELVVASEDGTRWACFLTETPQLIFEQCPDLLLVKGRVLVIEHSSTTSKS